MYKKTTLNNGIRVITNEIKDRSSIALGFWAGVGGRFEDDHNKGIAHFLEHIVFKGSRKYSCEEIKMRIEGVGGALNAFTTEEQTCFFAKIPSKHLDRTFDVLADMVVNPKVTSKDVAREKTVILEEIKMYRDLPQYFVQELLDGLLWPGHPLGKSLTGTAESVTTISSRDLKAFHKNYYGPCNIVVAACGRLKHEKIVSLVRKQLGSLKGANKADFVKVSGTQNEPRLKCHRKGIEQMHVALGMPAYHDQHGSRYALSLLNTIMGGNMSSRLFVEVREKRGLAYSISSSYKPLHDTGLFMIRAGIDNQKIVEAVKVILMELNRIKRRGVDTSEFRRGRDYLMGQLTLSLEDTMEHMLWIGEGVVSRNKARSLASVIKRFEKIRPVDMKRVANDIFSKDKLNLAVVGPLKEGQEKQLGSLLGV